MYVPITTHVNTLCTQALAEELKGQAGSLLPIKCDLTKDDQVLAMFARIKRKLGGVDVCINNAGMSINNSLLGKQCCSL